MGRMAAVVIVCSLIPIIVVMGALIGIWMGQQLAETRRRRREEYRASPRSHILNLHDEEKPSVP
jgi:hypothetical protein